MWVDVITLRIPAIARVAIRILRGTFVRILTLIVLTPTLSWGQSSGGRIAFTRVREDVRTAGDYRFEAEIWVMESGGTNPRRVTYNTSDDFGVAWSPDEKSIVFGATQFGPDGKAASWGSASTFMWLLQTVAIPSCLRQSTCVRNFPAGHRMVPESHSTEVTQVSAMHWRFFSLIQMAVIFVSSLPIHGWMQDPTGRRTAASLRSKATGTAISKSSS